MTLSTYLFFNGNCEQAFTFYKSVFGGEFSASMRFSEGPPDFTYDNSEKDYIMHATLPVGDAVLMGSDVGKAHGDAPKPGNNFAISFAASSRDEADRVFGALAEGGTLTMPMDATFWGSYFGMCTDKYGVKWMIGYDQS